MNITGPMLTRINKNNRKYVGKRGRIVSVSFVNAPPKMYAGQRYAVCVVDFDNGERALLQAAKNTDLKIGDNVRIVLKVGFTDPVTGLKIYIPKVVHENT